MFASFRRPVEWRWCAVALALAVPAVLTPAGCGGGGSGSAPGGGTTRSATTPLYLTDAPLSGATRVDVTISKIEARAAGSAGFVDTGITYAGNLLDLKNTEVLLGQAPLPAGQYTGLRLTLAGATITTADGVTHPLEPVTGLGGGDNRPGGPSLPSAATGKVAEALAKKHGSEVTLAADGRSATLLINAPFTVAADGTGTPLLLDFNVAHSVVATGNGRYLLKPVIPVVHKDEAGEVTGQVTLDPALAAGEGEPEVEVEATPSGQSEAQNATLAEGVRQGGKFRIPALPRGTYDVTVTAQGYAPVTLPSITITPGQKPDLGKIRLRKP